MNFPIVKYLSQAGPNLRSRDVEEAAAEIWQDVCVKLILKMNKLTALIFVEGIKMNLCQTPISSHIRSGKSAYDKIKLSGDKEL